MCKESVRREPATSKEEEQVEEEELESFKRRRAWAKETLGLTDEEEPTPGSSEAGEPPGG